MKHSLTQVAQSWERSLAQADRAQWPSISAEYLRYMVRAGILSKARRVASEVVMRARARAGVVPVTVRSARPLEDIDQLVAEVFPGSVCEVREIVDPAVIGGAEFTTAHQRIRSSYAHALEQFKNITK